jgi:hypothetical protein
MSRNAQQLPAWVLEELQEENPAMLKKPDPIRIEQKQFDEFTPIDRAALYQLSSLAMVPIEIIQNDQPLFSLSPQSSKRPIRDVIDAYEDELRIKRLKCEIKQELADLLK